MEERRGKNSFESSAWEKEEEEGGSGSVVVVCPPGDLFFHFPLILILLGEKEVCVGVWNNGMSVGWGERSTLALLSLLAGSQY